MPQAETRLTWDDLFSQDAGIDFARVFGCWPQINGKVLPVGLSAFGDAFFAKPDGSVWKLDVFSGQLQQVATSQEEFGAHMNSPAWQEAHLRSELVFQLKARGLERSPVQVFAPVPHPVFAGAVLLERAQVLDAVVWHSISSQALGQSTAAPAAGAKPWWKVW